MQRRYTASVLAGIVAMACSETSNLPTEPKASPTPPTEVGYDINVTAPNTTFNIAGAQWTSTYPFGVGTGQLDPFLSVQNSPSEIGFNTDANPLPLDDKRPEFTDALPLNDVPIIEEGGSLWREFILDANEAQSDNNSAAQFSIDVFDVYVCHDATAPTYDATTDFTSNVNCTRVYTLPDQLLATSDNTSGSGNTLDYRILIPASVFGATANSACTYNPDAADCGYYIVLYTEMGGVGGTWVTGSTFEEFSTIRREVAPTLTLVKQVVNDNGGTANASEWTLAATGASLSFSGAGAPATGTTATLGPNPVASGVQYTLSESGGPAGYSAAAAWVCTGAGTFVSPDKITLAAGESATCTITNNDVGPQLSLVKEVINDNGGTADASAWTLTATGTGGFSGTGSPATGTTATLGPNTVTAGVQYTLSESGGPSGYTAASAWVCTGTGGTFVSPDKITLALGASVSCKIVNNDAGPQLSLVKEVVNDNGGTANASEWTLAATGTSLSFSGAGSPATGTTATLGPNGVTAGVQYTLSESGGPSGYTAAAAWVCTGTGGTFVSPDKITLALGANVSCKIVNNDVGPQLSLVKEVINDNGGTANASAWTLAATGTTGSFAGPGSPATGTTATLGPNNVTAGVQYTLSESGGPSGYTAASAWVCTGTGGTFASPDKITLALGASVSCKIVNDDQAATLIVKKIVIGDGSTFGFTGTGTGVDPTFSIIVASNSFNTQTFSNLSAGTKTITEDAAPGYVLTDLGCTDQPAGTYDPTVTRTVSTTLALGSTVTCTFINEQQVGQTTRTQGFWATHSSLTQAVWFGGTVGGNTFTGVSDNLLCGRPIDTIGKLLGGFWSNIAQTTTKTKRSALDQARMRLLQQLLAAELNNAAFGSSPTGAISIQQAEDAYCGTDITAINAAASAMAAFNEGGDSGEFTPGVSANGKVAKTLANLVFWNVLP